MPLYLCQAGEGQADPWRHGIPVYAEPFVTSTSSSASSSTRSESALGGALLRRIRHAEVVLVDDVCISHERFWLRLRWPGTKGGFAGYVAVSSASQPHKHNSNDKNKNKNKKGDETELEGHGDANAEPETNGSNVSSSRKDNGRSKTTMSSNNQEDPIDRSSSSHNPNRTDQGEDQIHDQTKAAMDSLAQSIKQQNKEDEEEEEEDEDVDDLPFLPPSSDDGDHHDLQLQQQYGGVVVTCVRTGLPFGSSPSMKLMPLYDDGLQDLLPPIATIATKQQRHEVLDFSNREPVLCRICREGLHEDADDEQPTPAAEGEDGENNNDNNNNNRNQERSRARRSRLSSRRVTSNVSSDGAQSDNDNNGSPGPTTASSDLSRSPAVTCEIISNTGPVEPPPIYAPNPHALENPLLAPCNCTGSMAFVHYLCVEQWRCRSRHPAAQNGLACETCGGLYSLPPPASRPAPQNANHEAPDQDWLDAMPPHVIQALRQPHLLWQLGAAVVRRRWLRPLAPILVSPLVALYCRARRLLKKRGVARRRWACSLCRRRARWKCVRCLRSYYCSRQCQNVSWHIVHKHVCYKPIRTFWSVIVYGCLLLWAVPGILRDPLMYDLGLLIAPGSFLVIGVLAGGIATAFKKTAHIDLRGRTLEFTVLVGTLWLSAISWGLVQGFFGQSQACVGSLGRRQMIVTNADISQPVETGAPAGYFVNPLSSITGNHDGADIESHSGALFLHVLWWLRTTILVPAKSYYLFWDRWAAHSLPWIHSLICVAHDGDSNSTASFSDEEQQQKGCFEYLPHANADFFISKVLETPTAPAVSMDSNSTLLSTDLIVGPSKCAADLLLVTWLYFLAAVAYVGSALYKYQERRHRRLVQNQRRQQQVQQLRQQQAQLQAVVAAQERPHQD